jgi:hypothetical protein
MGWGTGTLQQQSPQLVLQVTIGKKNEQPDLRLLKEVADLLS